MKFSTFTRVFSFLLGVCLLFTWGQLYKTDAVAAANEGVVPQISIGDDYMLALNSAGVLYAWGDNANGVLGNGTETDSNTPVAVTAPAGVTFIAVSAGYSHAMALSSAGEVYTWGSDTYGQLGNGSTSSDPVKVPTKITVHESKKVVAVAAGYSFSVALLSDGSVYAWGINDKNQTGVDGETSVHAPTVIEGVTATAIAAGENNAAAIGHDGLIWSWGGNAGGQVSKSSLDVGKPSLPTQYTSSTTYFAKQVTINNQTLSFVTLAGEVKSRGGNLNGEFGNGTTSDQPTGVLKSASFAEGVLIDTVALGGTFALALCSEGEVYAWGDNAGGQLGLGDTESRSTPQKLTLPLESGDHVVAIAAGVDNAAAIDTSGFIWTWGDNTDGALGNGQNLQSSSPVSVTKENGDRFSLGVAPMIDIYNVSVTATVTVPAPTYGVTIPATLNVGELRQRETTDATRYSTTPLTVSVSDVDHLFGEKEIIVRLTTESGSFELKDGDHVLPYSIYATEDGEEALAVGGRFASFTENGSSTGRLVIDQSLITRKGSYGGTLIFEFSVEPLTETD